MSLAGKRGDSLVSSEFNCRKDVHTSPEFGAELQNVRHKKFAEQNVGPDVRAPAHVLIIINQTDGGLVALLGTLAPTDGYKPYSDGQIQSELRG